MPDAPPMRNPFLLNDKLYLRPLEEADAAVCHPWFSDPEVRVFIGRRAFPAVEKDSVEFIRRIDHVKVQAFAIVARATGDYIGNCGLEGINLADRHAEVGIAIGRKDYWGKGYGREALRLLCRHGFRTLNLHRIWLRVLADNERAVKSYAAIGFKPEGRLREDSFVDGRYVDSLIMGMLRGELEPDT